MASLSLDPTLLLFIANVAVAACVACAIGLLAAFLIRNRAVPLRHSFLVIAIALTLLCPLLLTMSRSFGFGLFAVSIEPPDSIAQATALSTQRVAHETARPDHPDLLSESRDSTATKSTIRPVGKPFVETKGTTPNTDSNQDAASIAANRLKIPQPSDRSTLTATTWRGVSTILVIGWLIGLVICMVRLFRGLLAVRRLRLTLDQVSNHRFRRATRWAFGAVGIRGDCFFESLRAPSPMTLGLFRPVVVLPTSFGKSLTDDELRCVMLHEAAHIKRHDTWIGLLQRIVHAMFWWNPLLHIANRRIADLREKVCDDYVVALHGNGRPLAQAIVKAAEWQSEIHEPLPCTATLASDTEELSERINRLTEKEHNMTLHLNSKAINVVVVYSMLLSAALLFPMLKLARAQAVHAEGSARETKTPGKNKENPINANAARREAKAMQALGQRYALEYATTILIFFDKNEDAHLSREEARNTAWPHSERTWFHGDKNSDNRVSRQELKDEYFAMYQRVVKSSGKQPHQFAEENWKNTDTNGDGRIDRSEARKADWLPAEQIWFRGDLDKDDKLTVNELRVHCAVGALDKGIRLRAVAAAQKQTPPVVPNVRIPVRAVETMLISKYDTNSDGALGPDEIRKMPWPRSEATFMHCDLNRDKRITLHELSDVLDLVYRKNAKQRQEMPDRFAVSNWQQFDSNRDGAIDAVERTNNHHPHKEHIAAWFDSDMDGDGKMTLSEMNLAFNYIALDKSIRMQAAVEKKHRSSQGGPKNTRAKPEGNTAQYSKMILDRFDQNGNGSINRDEARRAPWAKSEEVWFSADKNKDDRVTANELQSQYSELQLRLKNHGQRESHHHATWLMKVVDRNRDGTIDRNETQLTSWPRAAGNWFKGDANSDDRVTYDELVLAMAMNALDKGTWLAEAQSKQARSAY
jgi:beta-lactamase regulating signal transducer with metallopeptidase domain